MPSADCDCFSLLQCSLLDTRFILATVNLCLIIRFKTSHVLPAAEIILVVVEAFSSSVPQKATLIK